jgi:rhodanese-related sulfurtransferase
LPYEKKGLLRQSLLCPQSDNITEFSGFGWYTKTKNKGASHMGMFDFFKKNDINEGVRRYASTDNAVLLDVRSPQEYRQGHIPESMNVPLQDLEDVVSVAEDTPLFVYCYSGARSRQAAAQLRDMGYSNVHNIGGIATYEGQIE